MYILTSSQEEESLQASLRTLHGYEKVRIQKQNKMHDNIKHLNPEDWGFIPEMKKQSNGMLSSIIALAIIIAFLVEWAYLLIMLNAYVS